MRCFVSGLSVLGPGLNGWVASAPILAGEVPWAEAAATAPPPALLAPTERRRAGATVRFALAAATEASEGLDRAGLETVFASANGDGAVIGAMMAAMHDPEGAISPTQFHNSVHNAAAGYWHIAAGAQAPSISVGGHDGAFAAGLLTAMTALAGGAGPQLLCAYDTPMPPPFDAVRRTDFPFATALVLRAGPEGARAAFELAYRDGAAPLPPAEGLDALAEGNAAARALPVLRALAARRGATLRLPYLSDAHLELRVAPC